MPACLAIFPITVIRRLEPRCLASTRHRHCKQSYLEGVGSKHHSHMSPFLETGGKKSMVDTYHSLKGHVTFSNLTYESSTGPELGCLWCSKWPQPAALKMTQHWCSNQNLKEVQLGTFWVSPVQTISSCSIQRFAMENGSFTSMIYTNQAWLSIGNC